jgi:hypothetical protein
MTIYQENEQASAGSNLLTPQEQAICKQIAALEAPHSQHALALLALNERNTRAQAAEKTDLSTGQVKYWIARFRKQRLGIFPDALLSELDAEADVERVAEIEQEPESTAEKADSAKDKTKLTKARKGIKGKKGEKKIKKSGKKTRKVKKDKKGKKNKKDKKAKKSRKKNKKKSPQP